MIAPIAQAIGGILLHPLGVGSFGTPGPTRRLRGRLKLAPTAHVTAGARRYSVRPGRGRTTGEVALDPVARALGDLPATWVSLCARRSVGFQGAAVTAMLNRRIRPPPTHGRA